MDTIGKRIAWARRQVAIARGLKVWGQGKLAEAAGWDKSKRQRISMYEKDKREPSLEDIRKLAHPLNVHPSWLAFGEVAGEHLASDERELLIAFRGLHEQHKGILLQFMRVPQLPAPYTGPERRKQPRSGRPDPTILRKLPSRD